MLTSESFHLRVRRLGPRLQEDRETTGSLGTDAGSNLRGSGRSHRVLRGPPQSPPRSAAPPGLTATPRDRTSHFPPAPRAPTAVHSGLTKYESVILKEKQKLHSTSIICFHLWSAVCEPSGAREQ